MNRLTNAIKMHAAAMDAQAGAPRFGIVTSYDPNGGYAKVELQPEGTLSGWLPVLSPWAGSGWGIHVPLPIGSQVYVSMQEGDSDHGVILGRTRTQNEAPPAADATGLILQHSSGTFIKLSDDGTATIQDSHGSYLEMQNNGTVAVKGILAVTGSIKVNNVNVSVP